MGIATALLVSAAVAAAGTAVSAYQQNKASKQAEAESKRQQQARLQQEQDFNRQNQNTADIGALLQGNTPSGSAGLTGGTYKPGQLGSGGMLGR